MKILLCFSLLFCSLPTLGQKHANTWYFGIKAGLNFSTNPPTSIFDGKTGTDVSVGDNQEGTSCISDSAGNLLFYTGGATIWNREHQPMPNGLNIMGGVSSTQTSIIIPKPANSRLFYVFTTDHFQNYFTPPNRGYRYSLVDICLDNGNGDVISNQKNILLLDSSTEKISACRDAGSGYWVIGHKMFSNAFYAWHLTETGISAPVISSVGTIHGWNASNSTWNPGAAQGQMKFNAQGTKLAVALGNTDPATVEIFDFNKSNGLITKICRLAIDSLLNKTAYGLEFSPDGSKLYVGVAGGVGGKRLYQFDIATVNCNSIENSRVTIFQSNHNSLMQGMQLGPDNKIYLLCNSNNDLGCINSPDLSGNTSNFDSSVITLSPGVNGYTLPTFVAGFNYSNIGQCDTTRSPTCYPELKIINPFIGNLVITKKPSACRVKLSIFNSLGQLITTGVLLNDGDNIIRMPSIPAGVYYCRFAFDSNKLYSRTIIKL